MVSVVSLPQPLTGSRGDPAPEGQAPVSLYVWSVTHNSLVNSVHLAKSETTQVYQ